MHILALILRVSIHFLTTNQTSPRSIIVNPLQSCREYAHFNNQMCQHTPDVTGLLLTCVLLMLLLRSPLFPQNDAYVKDYFHLLTHVTLSGFILDNSRALLASCKPEQSSLNTVHLQAHREITHRDQTGRSKIRSCMRHQIVFQIFSQDLVSSFHQNLCQRPEFIFQYQIPQQTQRICRGSTRLVQNSVSKRFFLLKTDIP